MVMINKGRYSIFILPTSLHQIKYNIMITNYKFQIHRMGKPKAKSKTGAKQKTTSKKTESKHNINDLLDKVNISIFSHNN